jgi:hypothetical protein
MDLLGCCRLLRLFCHGTRTRFHLEESVAGRDAAHICLFSSTSGWMSLRVSSS